MVDVSRERRARDLFESMLDLGPEERADALGRACGDDQELREAVERLLRSDERALAFLDEPALLGSGRSLIGRQLGAFRLVEIVGEGGTSTVYRAERVGGGFEQEVAVKVLRMGMDSESMRRRFREERQILARLEHPAIARVLDGGTTEDHLPYVVMEYVRGEPIDRHCDRERTTLRRRLRLFLEVCEAVSAAHRQLVVHLDLKPSNILVDSDGRPRLVDFGIARALRSFEEGDPTRPSTVRLLTPGYASPEQISGDDVSTSSDVFALGVVLCELVAGERPFDWRGLTTPEIVRRLERSTPVAPSELALTLDDPAGRAGSLRVLHSRLKGDLDRIVLEAVRQEPAFRYQSVDDLASDVRRHLDGLPLEARRAEVVYRARRWARRNAAMLLVLVALAGLSVFSVSTALRLERERDRAEQERRSSDRVLRLLTDSVEAANPFGESSREVTALQVAEEAVRDLENLAGEPRVQAKLEQSIGELFHALGRYDRALELLESSLEKRRGLDHDDPASLASARLALSRLATDRSELDLARHHAEEALGLLRDARDDRDPMMADALWQLAQVFHEKGEYPRAKELGLESLAFQERVLGEDHEAVATTLTSLARAVYFPGELEEAEAMARKAVERSRAVFGPRHPSTAEAIRALAHVLIERGEIHDAKDHAEMVLGILQERLPPTHHRLAGAMNDVAVIHYRLGDYREAARRFEEALELKRRLDAADDQIATGLHNLAFVLRRLGDLEAARRAYEEALVLERRSRGEDHPFVAQTLRGLGDLLRELGDYPASERRYLEALAIDRKAFGSESAEVARDHYDLGRLFSDWARYREARASFATARRLREELLGAGHGSTALVVKHQGILERRTGKLERSLESLRAAAEVQEETEGAQHPATAATRLELAAALCDLGRFEGAAAIARSSLEILSSSGVGAWQTAGARSVLGCALAGLGEEEEARRLFEGAVRDLEDTVGPSARATREVRQRLERTGLAVGQDA